MFLCFGKYVFQWGDHNPAHLSTKRAMLTRGLGILAFPEALARLVLRHTETARKTAPPQKLKRSVASGRCRALCGCSLALEESL